ncbi:MAG TPA: FISUMP domain-containing protein [Tenuifilaceae bacterium]|nr:FISUMP domain-containing protein [Tenuifilaceae bacterium]
MKRELSKVLTLLFVLTAFISCKKEQPTGDIPVLTTAEITEITKSSAVGGGNITSDNGHAVFVRGVVWGTHDNPTINDNKTVDGSGTGSFVSQLKGLEPETVYYVRAYAANSKGTAYGNSVVFQTLAFDIPVLTTAEVTAITHNSATCGGTITSDGGEPVIARGVVWATHENPTIEDNKTTDGAGMGSFVSQITGLEPETVYHVRAYATNAMGTAYGNSLVFQTLAQPETGTFIDNRDGTVYKTIKIGSQVWMAENLRYLPSVVGPETSSDSEPCYYVYNYNGTDVEEAKATTIYSIFGALYNWPAAMNGETSSSTNPSGVKGVCPDNWHLPSDAEWTQLVEYLGGENVAGGKMKENSNLYWISPNIDATNTSGFTALPGGYLYYDNHFHHLGYYASWWSATAGYNGIYDRYINNDSGKIYRSESGKSGGWSVRCVKD